MTTENKNARPGRRSETGAELADEATASVTQEPCRLLPLAAEDYAKKRARYIRRQAGRDLDALFRHVPPSSITTADVLSLTVAPAHVLAATCPGRHEHDYWGVCTGMNLGFPERRAAGLDLLDQGWAA